MAFTPPVWFETLYWAQRDGDEGDPLAPLVEIRPGELDCTETALRRIWKQFEGAASWETLFGVIGATFQQLELGLGSVDQARYISTAEGQQLDEIGYAVGRSRGALTDDSLYRLAIIADAATLFSSGTTPEVVEITRALLGDGVRVTQYYPAAVVISAPDVETDVFLLLLDVLKEDLLVVGVGGVLETWDSEAVGGWGSTTDPGDTEIAEAGEWSSTTGTDADDGLALWSTGQALGSLS